MFSRRFTRISLAIAVLSVIVLAAPSVALAAGGTPYPGDLGQALAALVIFVLLLLVLRKYAWGPIVTQLNRREEDIAARIKDAENRQAKADELAGEYREQLEHIDRKLEEMLTEAREDADAERQEILSAARDEARQAVERAREDIDNASQAARRDLQSATARLAADLAEQFLAKKLSEEDYDRLFEESTQQLARKSSNEIE